MSEFRGVQDRPSDLDILVALPLGGYADAIERVAFTSAPLLAGFAVTFIGLILGSNVSMHTPNATLAALTAAAVLLIVSIQLAFTARIGYLPFSEFEARLRLAGCADSYVRWEYVQGLLRYRKLIRWCGVAYNLGIAALLGGVTMALVPGGELGQIDTERAIAIGIAAIATIFELAWTLSGELDAWEERRAERRMKAENDRLSAAGNEGSESRPASSSQRDSG